MSRYSPLQKQTRQPGGRQVGAHAPGVKEPSGEAVPPAADARRNLSDGASGATDPATRAADLPSSTSSVTADDAAGPESRPIDPVGECLRQRQENEAQIRHLLGEVTAEIRDMMKELTTNLHEATSVTTEPVRRLDLLCGGLDVFGDLAKQALNYAAKMDDLNSRAPPADPRHRRRTGRTER